MLWGTLGQPWTVVRNLFPCEGMPNMAYWWPTCNNTSILMRAGQPQPIPAPTLLLVTHQRDTAICFNSRAIGRRRRQRFMARHGAPEWNGRPRRKRISRYTPSAFLPSRQIGSFRLGRASTLDLSTATAPPVTVSRTLGERGLAEH